MDEILVLILTILIIIGGIAIGSMKVEKLSCMHKANALGYKYEWGYLQGCIFEKPDGQRILLEKLRYNELD